jgi:hypothetical protein
MNNFWKRLDWKKFVKYEFYCFLIVTFLYVLSLLRHLNVFPQNIWIIPFIVIGFAVLMLLKSHTVYIEEKIFKKE